MKLIFASDYATHNLHKDEHDNNASSVLGEVAELFKAYDFSMLNLESIYGDAVDYEPIVKDGPNLIAEKYFENYLDFLNPTAIGLANNHTYDYHEKPLIENIDVLKKKGYLVAGAGKDIDEAYKPIHFEKDGIKISIIVVCENEYSSATKEHGGSAGFLISKVTKQISDALEDARLPIIYFHGGNERNPLPSPGKVELYRHFIDLGAKAVIAMHTHCPQGYETYKGAPIVYSMGNFFFPTKRPEMPSWNTGYMSELTIEDGAISFNPIPYRFSFEKLSVLQGDEKEAFLKYLKYISSIIKDEDLLAKYFDAWCMYKPKNWVANGIPAPSTSQEEIKVELNFFSCEAHNEALKNLMKVYYDGKTDEAEKLIPSIQKMQNLEIVE